MLGYKESLEINKSNNEKTNRNLVVIKTSIIGILTNVFLVIFKIIVGLASNSIAIILDAINNLSDALSSLIAIIGTKLASKSPNKKHPFGYGRIEYITAMIISGIILYAGITSIIESIKKIIKPETPTYNTSALIIIIMAIIVKVILGRYVVLHGRKINSSSLVASGSDALFDAILSTSVLISAIIFKLTNISLEAYVSVVISIIIIKAGIEMMQDTLNELIGIRSDKEITNKIKNIIVTSESKVRGAYDLFMYNYGPNKYYASVHIELPDDIISKEIDEITRRLENKVYKETGVLLAGIGIYSYNTKDNTIKEIESKIRKIVLQHEWAIQLHGFYLDINRKEMKFDVVMSFDIDHKDGVSIIHGEISKFYPEYNISIQPDIDMSTTD